MKLHFFDELPKLFPHADARAWFKDLPENVLEYVALRNSSLQGAYFMLAARSLGLDCGPMSGFDNKKVDAAFFAGTTIKSNFLCNVGHGDPSKLYPRSPRLAFEDVARWSNLWCWQRHCLHHLGRRQVKERNFREAAKEGSPLLCRPEKNATLKCPSVRQSSCGPYPGGALSMIATELQEVADAIVRRAERQGFVVPREIREEVALAGLSQTQWKEALDLARHGRSIIAMAGITTSTPSASASSRNRRSSNRFRASCAN